jgi:lipopolysaccharide/colanic/teichoic acid biosynthesis glycosyltransferase
VVVALDLREGEPAQGAIVGDNNLSSDTRASGRSVGFVDGGVGRVTIDLDAEVIDLTAMEGRPPVALAAPAEDRQDAPAPPEPRISVEDALELVRRASAPPRSRRYEVAKRALDIALTTVALVVALPLMALIAVAIRLDSPGPAVFRQRRVGRHGEVFEFCKFRTMRIDARERFPELYAYDFSTDELGSMYFKLPHDPRCTRFGRWLRRTSLDELPNLVNVLRGDMSLVGPRPEIPEMLPFYEPHQLCKFAVKPGLTGLAQTCGRNILRFVETNAKDVEYVQRRSLAFDLRILVRTTWCVALMIGAH